MEELAQLYKALSEETRIRIMLLLMQGELLRLRYPGGAG